jgi:hypothetical protein
MKRYIATAAAVLTLFVLNPTPGAAAEVTYHSPNTVAAQTATDLLTRGARAISAYVSACADQDTKRIHSAITADAVVEYPSADIGTYFAVDSSDIDQFCATDTHGRATGLWLFPTNEANSLFVEYRVTSDKSSPSGKTSEHLVLLTMRGDKIARLRDLTMAANIDGAAASDRAALAR